MLVRLPLFLIIVIFSPFALAQQAKVAIIIDDIGYRKSDIGVLSLPGKITYAILPHTPFGKDIANQAHNKQLDVILHIPMEATNGKKLGPGALTSEMNEENIRNTLAKSFEEIPFALGINNHMGSYLTQLYSPMMWTMRYLKENQLIFIDSVTTEQSRGRSMARHMGVPSLSRHIFLDNQLTEEYISSQFKLLIAQAQQYKRVVAIAHPHPETIAILTKLLPQLSEHDISLVGISAMLPKIETSEKAISSD